MFNSKLFDVERLTLISMYFMVDWQELMKEDIKPLMWYPVVYLLTTICPLIDRFVKVAQDFYRVNYHA